MNKNKKIYILIGMKGSGKSLIGELFEKYFQIHFVRVENWAREIKKDRAADDVTYIEEFFEITERRIKEFMNYYEEIVYESTGLTPYFDNMYNHLQTSFHVILIKIEANPQLCLNRVRTRDQNIHIDVSDDLVKKINQEVLLKNIPCEYSIENSRTTVDDLRLKIGEIIDRVREI